MHGFFLANRAWVSWVILSERKNFVAFPAKLCSECLILASRTHTRKRKLIPHMWLT
jgi:hypothetical protein